jgi:hypothetical protein
LADELWGNDDDDIMFGGDGLDHLDLDQNGICEDYSPLPELSRPYDCEDGPDDTAAPEEDEGDFMDGGNGNDIMFGQLGNDTMLGQSGDDVVFGGEGNDFMSGGADDDILFGEEGNDKLIGANGDDFLGGGVGDDTIYGGDGDDFILGGEGDDELTGGDGKDVFFSDLTLSYDGSDHTFSSTDGTDVITDFDFNEDQDVLGFRVTVDSSAEGTLGDTVLAVRTKIFELLDAAASVSEGDAGVGTGATDTVIEIGGHTIVLQDVNWQDVVDFPIAATTFTSLGQDSDLAGGVGINSTANGLDSGGYTAIGSWDVENDLYCPDLPEVSDWYCASAVA